MLPPIAYDDELTVRTVKTSGQIQLSNRLIFVSQALAGERIALRPTRIDGIWQVQFCHQVMGLLDQRDPQGPTVRFGLNDPTEID